MLYLGDTVSAISIHADPAKSKLFLNFQSLQIQSKVGHLWALLVIIESSVLAQDSQGKEHVVAYASRTLSQGRI